MTEYITISEAIKITGKSKSTIRRFVQAHIDNYSIIKQEVNERNRPLYKINKAFILSYYSLESSANIYTESGSNKNRIEHEKKLLLLQEKITTQKKQNRVILISLISVFIAILIAGTYYHFRLQDKLNDELDFYVKYQSNNQKTYEVSKQELKDAYKKLLNEKQDKINNMEKLIKEYKDNSINTANQIKTLEKDREKLLDQISGRINNK